MFEKCYRPLFSKDNSILGRSCYLFFCEDASRLLTVARSGVPSLGQAARPPASLRRAWSSLVQEPKAMRYALAKAFSGSFFGHTCPPLAYGDHRNRLYADCCSLSLIAAMVYMEIPN
jgi:hypothetical protein